MLSRRFFSVVSLMMVLAVLSACGGAPPISLAEVPKFPGSTPMQAGTNPFADTVLEQFNTTMSEQNLKLEQELYSIPQETTWEDIKAFYSDNSQISGGSWTPSADMTQESEGFSSMGWTRNGGRQVLLVGHSPDLLNNNSQFLLIVLASQ